eukprot:Hpha_TRINITY_DN22987_c0_g1::TRINITY_DN22987_c0_g1_i1::g.154027::m.154027
MRAVVLLLMATGVLGRSILFMKSPTAAKPVGGYRWNQGDPGGFSVESFTSALAVLPGRNASGKFSVGLTFQWELLDCFLSPHSCSVPQAIDGIKTFLNAATLTNTTVEVTLDPNQFWYNTALWNWYDPKQPGYNPNNTHNVEWTGPGPEYAMKIAWRDWGSQFRMPTPQPNLCSPSFLEVVRGVVNTTVGALRQWYDAATPTQQSLLTGVKLGEEIDVGANYYFYEGGNAIYDKSPTNASDDPTHGPDWSKGVWGGLSPQGFAMRASRGLTNTTKPPDGTEIGDGVKEYVTQLADAVQGAWPSPPPGLFGVHLGHTGEGLVPWDAAMVTPFVPAYSFYPPGVGFSVPAGLKDALRSYETKGGPPGLVVGEWFCFACKNAAEWERAFAT